MNYSRFINKASALRITSPIRKLTELQAAGGDSMISFGTGAPNVSMFPFESMDIKLKNGDQYILRNGSLSDALQYLPTQGYPDLVFWLKDLQSKLHNPPILRRMPEIGMDLLITPGSQDGLSKIFDMVLNSGDHVLIEEPTYPGTLAGLLPYKVVYEPVEVDGGGLVPKSLKSVLEKKWRPEDRNDPQSNIPKLLYLQPNNANPCGVSLSLERRQEIIKIAQLYDLLIVEDDPYYFLSFDKSVPPSFLSLDKDGRVLRLDSFSKVLSSGFRLGFVTGAKPLIQRLMLHLQVTSMHCSSLSQVIVYQLLKQWGMDVFLEHTQKVANFYKSQCDAMVEAAQTHLSDVAEWEKPNGGMFLWMKVKGVKDTRTMINERALTEKVVLAPGNVFLADGTRESPYLRASFSNVNPKQMNEGFIRLKKLIRNEQKLQDQ